MLHGLLLFGFFGGQRLSCHRFRLGSFTLIDGLLHLLRVAIGSLFTRLGIGFCLGLGHGIIITLALTSALLGRFPCRILL